MLSSIRADLRFMAGADIVVDAAAVTAAFGGVNRVVSSTGVRGRPQQRMAADFSNAAPVWNVAGHAVFRKIMRD